MKVLILLKKMKEYFGSSQVLIQTQIDEAIKELEELQQSNKDLLNTVIEAQKVIKNVLEGKQ